MRLTVNPPWRKPLDSPTSAEGRPTQRFLGILLAQGVTVGEDVYHFRHVLGSPGAQRHDRVAQAAAERGQRVVNARRHLFVGAPRQPAIRLRFLQLLDQHLVADALDRALEIAVALRAVEQEVQDLRCPLGRDDAERGGEPVGEVATAGFRTVNEGCLRDEQTR
jgi:hypothetical protein